MQALIEAFRRAARPIVHVVRIYQPDGSNVDVCRRRQVQSGAEWLLSGSRGSQIAAELLPNDNVRLEPQVLLTGRLQEIGPDEVVCTSHGGARSLGPLSTTIFVGTA
jgi:hypothetical protein